MMIRSLFYWLTRPICKASIYPGSIKVFMYGEKHFRKKGRALLEALGGRQRLLHVPSKTEVDTFYLEASSYRDCWPRIQKEYKEILRQFTVIPGFPSLSAALGMPNLVQEVDDCVVIICHGNAMFYEMMFAEMATYLDRGFDISLFNLPGFGDSVGSPNAETSLETIEAVYKDVRRRKGADVKIWVHGLSLGGAVAAQLLGRYRDDPKLYLVLDRSFISLGSVAKDLFPLIGVRSLVDWLYPYHICEDVKGLGRRALVIQAAHDNMMRSYHAKMLTNCISKGTEEAVEDLIMKVSGGHNHGDGGEVCWIYDAKDQKQFSSKIRLINDA